MHWTPWILALSLFLTSCGTPSPEPEDASITVEAQLIMEQVLEGQEGDIHYSYYLPEGYDEANT